jgi:hypothetical protein
MNDSIEQRREEIKEQIKQIFDLKIRGHAPTVWEGVARRDSHEGHWLEFQFGLKPNGSNTPDFSGFELKDDTSSKTTFGDWPADMYLFFSHKRCETSQAKASGCLKCCNSLISRDEFLITFGTATARGKDNQDRFSWSGKVFPKIGPSNEYGQSLRVEVDGSVTISYSHSLDQRPDKNSIVRSELRKDDIVLAHWTSEKLKLRLERKFNQLGWFKCVQTEGGHGAYTAIKFGGPINFLTWIEQVKTGTVYLDSGMYLGNNRPYSSWRASNKFWDSLVEETY